MLIALLIIRKCGLGKYGKWLCFVTVLVRGNGKGTFLTGCEGWGLRGEGHPKKKLVPLGRDKPSHLKWQMEGQAFFYIAMCKSVKLPHSCYFSYFNAAYQSFFIEQELVITQYSY